MAQCVNQANVGHQYFDASLAWCVYYLIWITHSKTVAKHTLSTNEVFPEFIKNTTLGYLTLVTCTQ